MNTFYNVLIGFAAIGVGILAFISEIVSRFRRLRKADNLSVKIGFFLFFSALGIVATVLKDNNAEAKATKAEDEARDRQERHAQELKSRDSINSVQLDASNQRIVKVFKDSAAYVADVPYLDFCFVADPIFTGVDSATGRNCIYVKLCNVTNYPAYNLDLIISIFAWSQGQAKILARRSLGFDRPFGNGAAYQFSQFVPKDLADQTDTLIYYLTGSYENSFHRAFPMRTYILFHTKAQKHIRDIPPAIDSFFRRNENELLGLQ